MPSMLEDSQISSKASRPRVYLGHRSSPPPSSGSGSSSPPSSSASSSSHGSSSSYFPNEKTSFLSPTAPPFIDDDCLVITRDPEPDAIHHLPWQRFVARLFFVTGAVPCFLAIWASYIQAQTLAFSPIAETLPLLHRWLAWLMLALDFVTNIDSLLAVLVKASTSLARWRPRLLLLGDNGAGAVPFVDVLIPVCNERLDIIQDTVRAALRVDYPPHRFRVVVSDDGASAELRAWVESLSQGQGQPENVNYPKLYYTSRVKQGARAAGYKAGNLNHALEVVRRLPGGAADYVAGLDADMVPERKWLRSVAAHIVRDDMLGLVCPAQLMYNTPHNDPLYQTSAMNWYCMDIVRDLGGCGWNLGSGWIVRREAVEDIGGFPTDCLIEDVCSSMMMQACGWRTMYIPQGLQYGLVPETYLGHVKQFTRWYIGGCQMALRFRGYISQTWTRRMPLITRLVGFSSSVSVHIKPHAATLGMVMTPLLFLTNTRLVYWQDADQMRLLLRIHCALVLTKWLHSCHLAVLAGYRTVMMDTCLSMYMAPYFTTAWFRSFILPSSLGGRVTTFTATGSLRSSVHERSRLLRAPLYPRLRHILFDCGAWVQLLVIFVSLLTAGLRVRHIMISQTHSNPLLGQEVYPIGIQLLQSVAWPSHIWIPATLSCLTPLRYALSPPDVADRDELMGKREQGGKGARYARPEAKAGSWSGWECGFVQLYTVFIVFVGGLFVVSWSM